MSLVAAQRGCQFSQGPPRYHSWLPDLWPNVIHHLQSFANLYQQALGSHVLKRFIRMLDQSERNVVLGQALFIGVSSLTSDAVRQLRQLSMFLTVLLLWVILWCVLGVFWGTFTKTWTQRWPIRKEVDMATPPRCSIVGLGR